MSGKRHFAQFVRVYSDGFAFREAYSSTHYFAILTGNATPSHWRALVRSLLTPDGSAHSPSHSH